MTDKYKLTDNTIITEHGIKLYRIQCLRDFDDVKKDDLGGFVTNKFNLSQDGNAWIYNDAMVIGHARVYQNGKIYHNVIVSGDARISNDAKVFNNVSVSGNGWVYDQAVVGGNVKITDYTSICGMTTLKGDEIINNNYIHNNIRKTWEQMK